MGVVSIRVRKELKEEMEKTRVNWPEYLREVIRKKIQSERFKRACRAMDESREKTAGVKFDSVSVIRKTRESR
ncbi:MAG: hypothetical protein ACE5OY_06570 [Candidatus Bathyarchaeia archaeon]